LHLHGTILIVGAKPVLRNVAKRTSVLRSGRVFIGSALRSCLELRGPKFRPHYSASDSAMMCSSRFVVSRVTLREELPPDLPLLLFARRHNRPEGSKMSGRRLGDQGRRLEWLDLEDKTA
jgi:hypothetical protein